ncbi:MAG: tRNA dihydrouridine synthase DusB [Candidatus Muproteobacteria bacterium RBG_16_62_13]|uniref:tRNA-dihydrouridine synthase B n=1 Tax=Candidatus Muproteobacteria bacterium RBG_16_62_13 TaxID=1817756 RepID=A0A1F6T1M4_9PROT|nr:MAG: tRNA dihydrouridine synthase DusB [Candidatus Muproteobacteria bacterium RBG_16_62_13]
MRIGPYELKNNLFLAPMAGVTDRPFRALCRRLGAGMAVSEMVSCNSLLWGSEKTRRRADHTGEDEPRSVQILGTDPAMMAQAARTNVDQGAQIIDINMGCPAKKVCNVAAGSALLRHEALVADILQAVVRAVNVPVTLKFRTGWDRQNRNGVAIARLAEDCGVQLLSVHGRTRADQYQGEAEYETIAAIKAAVRIPVVANGDITGPEKAAHVLRATGADGLMIGRAAQGNPWIFREIAHYLATGEVLPAPAVSEVRDVLLEHLDNLHAFYGVRLGTRVARKHIGWYSKGLRGGAVFRHEINRVEDAGEQRTRVRDFFDARVATIEDLAA